jgi:8-oxo-dGTP pyrophosphatase MutT (NUDIX family)
MSQERFRPYGVVHLLLRRDDEILLAERPEGSGWEERNYGFVSGHLEQGETARQAMAREAYEELGIIIDPHDLNVVFCMHRFSNRENIDLFMECWRWKGRVENKEPKNCAELSFFKVGNLPLNLMPHVKKVLDEIDQGNIYGEFGWPFNL